MTSYNVSRRMGVSIIVMGSVTVVAALLVISLAIVASLLFKDADTFFYNVSKYVIVMSKIFITSISGLVLAELRATVIEIVEIIEGLLGRFPVLFVPNLIFKTIVGDCLTSLPAPELIRAETGASTKVKLIGPGVLETIQNE